MEAPIGIFLALALASIPSEGRPAVDSIVGKAHVAEQVAVRAVPTTPDSKPFHSMSDLAAKHDYVEEEFFLSGTARAYEWVGNSFDIRAISDPGPYTIRILVLRPRDPGRFSGNAEVELLNSTRGYDVAASLSASADLVMQRGDVIVLVTSKAIAVDALKQFDAKRYADLAWSNPVPEAKRCESPSIFPLYPTNGAPTPGISSTSESEDGLIYEIYAQLGKLLKSQQRNQILPGFARPKLFSMGTSQSGFLQRTFINAFHPVMRLPDGGSIYDGYFVEVGAGALRINQCSIDILPTDKRTYLRDIDVPIVNLFSEGDMGLARSVRQPDRIRQRSGLVNYEVAGGFHLSGMARAPLPELFLPRPLPDEVKAKGIVLSDFPRGYISRAALILLQKWSNEGKTPPTGQPLKFEGAMLVRDANGNAVGGIRSVWVDVPIASYLGSIGPGVGSVIGGKIPFSAEKIRQLYPTPQDYIARVKAGVARMVEANWLLEEDADTVVKTATNVSLSNWVE